MIADARRAAADFTGADPDEIVFGPNATTPAVARRPGRSPKPGAGRRGGGDPAGPRRERPAVGARRGRDAGATVRWVDVHDDDVTIDRRIVRRALCRSRTKLVAFTLASNAVGTIPPRPTWSPRAKAVGALVARGRRCISRSTALPDLHGIGADLSCARPYKFFGPHLGMLAARREPARGVAAVQAACASSDDVPERWETGTQNHEGLAGLVAAVDYLAGVRATVPAPRGEIASPPPSTRSRAHERMLADWFLAGLATLPPSAVGHRPTAIASASGTPTFAIQRSATSIRPRRRRRSAARGISSGTATTTPAR